ncbi:hypothetical protein BH20ACT2_BH20ACT2_17450 [soil metagenome]
MALTGALEGRTVVRGATLALLVAAPAALASEALVDDEAADGGSNLVFVFFLIILVAFLAGGALAGRGRPDVPLVHGAAAAAAAYLVLQGAGTVARLFRGDDLSPLRLVFNGLLLVSAGILGALVATRTRRRR